MQAHIPWAPAYQLPTSSPIVLACSTLPCFYHYKMSPCFPQPSPLHMPSPILRLSTTSPKMRSLLWVFPSSLYHDTTSLLLGLCFKCFILIHLSCPRDCELPVVSEHIYHCASPELALCLLEGAGWILGINKQIKSPCRALERLVGNMMVSPKERFCPYNCSLF